jgi:sec-independent protein translocase protein TatB
MFDVGFWELTLLATIALLVLGPERLPAVVTSIGRMMGRARSLARGLKMQIEREMNQINTTDIKPKNQPKQPRDGSDDESKPTE